MGRNRQQIIKPCTFSLSNNINPPRINIAFKTNDCFLHLGHFYAETFMIHLFFCITTF